MIIQSKDKIREFSISTIERINTYKIEIQQEVTLFGEVSNNNIDFLVEKRFIKKDTYGYLFEITVSNRNQLDTEDFSGLEFEFSKLQDHLLIYTNEQGALLQLINKEELLEKWDNLKNEISKNFKGFYNLKEILSNMESLLNAQDGYLKVFKDSEIGTLLFPSIYSPVLKEKPLNQHKFYLNFFGDISLPLRTKTEFLGFKKEQSVYKVCKSGILAKSLLDLDGIKKYFRSLYNSHVFIEAIDIDYAELYDLDSMLEVQNAIQVFYLTLADDIYTFDQKVLITKVEI